jgi:outer membrane protein OmpA-like peptidoglycan-associated protein
VLKFLAAIVAAATVAGCAAPRGPELFAVIPSKADGHVGAVVVRSGSSERVIDSAYGAQRISPDGTVAFAKLDAQQVQREFGDTLAALPGTPTSYMLYFLEGKDELTPESKVEMDKVFADLKKRPLPDIVVIGHTDTVGGSVSNDRLSLARAERMREMMIALGIPAQRIHAAGRGKRELLVPTDENVSEPRNRRVEINVR